MKTRQPLQLSLGICPFTGNKIAEIKNGELTRLPNFGKWWLLLSNGQKMEVWIDKGFRPTQKDSQRLLEAHLSHWEKSKRAQIEQIERSYNQFKKLSLVAHGRREKDINE